MHHKLQLGEMLDTRVRVEYWGVIARVGLHFSWPERE